MNEIQRIKYLIGRYLDNVHSPEEGQELFELLKDINDPDILEDIFHEEWSESGRENLEHILSYESLMQERENRAKKKAFYPARVVGLWKWGVAASLLVIIGMVWWQKEVPAEIMTWQTGYGETREIVLDDGTKVVLNANSRLEWDADWKEMDQREVVLTGEAYFEVSHVDKQGTILIDSAADLSRLIPFKVLTTDLAINVLGTSFNVLNRRGKTDVYLDEGKVKLLLLDNNPDARKEPTDSNPDDDTLQTLIMSPGDVVSFSASTQDLTQVEAEHPQSFTEWKDGTLIFENLEFGVMLDRLEDLYGKDFILSDSTLLKLPVNFSFPYENWETVTQLMELSFNVDLIEEQNNKVRLEKNQ